MHREKCGRIYRKMLIIFQSGLLRYSLYVLFQCAVLLVSINIYSHVTITTIKV